MSDKSEVFVVIEEIEDMEHGIDNQAIVYIASTKERLDKYLNENKIIPKKESDGWYVKRNANYIVNSYLLDENIEAERWKVLIKNGIV